MMGKWGVEAGQQIAKRSSAGRVVELRAAHPGFPPLLGCSTRGRRRPAGAARCSDSGLPLPPPSLRPIPQQASNHAGVVRQQAQGCMLQGCNRRQWQRSVAVAAVTHTSSATTWRGLMCMLLAVFLRSAHFACHTILLEFEPALEVGGELAEVSPCSQLCGIEPAVLLHAIACPWGPWANA